MIHISLIINQQFYLRCTILGSPAGVFQMKADDPNPRPQPHQAVRLNMPPRVFFPFSLQEFGLWESRDAARIRGARREMSSYIIAVGSQRTAEDICRGYAHR